MGICLDLVTGLFLIKPNTKAYHQDLDFLQISHAVRTYCRKLFAINCPRYIHSTPPYVWRPSHSQTDPPFSAVTPRPRQSIKVLLIQKPDAPWTVARILTKWTTHDFRSRMLMCLPPVLSRNSQSEQRWCLECY